MNAEEEQPPKRSRRDYELDFKMRVVREVESGRMSYHEAQKVYGIQGKSTVLVWLRKHGCLDWKYPKKQSTQRKNELHPEKRIKQLESALKRERTRNQMYENLFEILEKEQGIQLPEQHKELDKLKPGKLQRKV
jgi:transposase